ncbi:MAG TPA: carbonic anhydrase [Phycisphaerae bacterium]|nr:carbonic anhydrase [Phycisphaerae bacterium]
MQKLVEGVHSFQKEIFGTKKGFYERLAKGQNPIALFITCSDSRINPNLLTQTDPGDLFILRNAGNIVPPYSAKANGGEAATIEFAVSGLGVRDIIICGHSHCGAMKGILEPDSLSELPAVAEWLTHAEATRRIIREKYRELEGPARLTATVEENVLVQVENLRTHPSVAAAMAQGKLNLHAWVYKLESGQVFDFDPVEGQFLALGEQPARGLDAGPQRRIDRSI